MDPRPLTRNGRAKRAHSDLSPPELGFTRVRHLKVAQVGYIRLGLGRGQERLRSAGECDSLLCARFGFGGRPGRQLQDSRLLALAQEGEKERVPIRQLERIMMHMRLRLIDLAEDCGAMR